MKCHYINDKIAGRVLIPGCMATAIHNDEFYCTCHFRNKGMDERLEKLEEETKKLKKLIKILTNKTEQ